MSEVLNKTHPVVCIPGLVCDNMKTNKKSGGGVHCTGGGAPLEKLPG